MSQFSAFTPNNQQGSNLRQTARFFIHQAPRISQTNCFVKSPKSSTSIGNFNTIKTSSKIILPAGKHHFNKDRKIRWVRSYCGVSEKLFFMDDLLYFQCSPLDFDCILEASIEYTNDISTMSQDKMQYGPIAIDTDSGVKVDGYQKIPIQCLTIFDGQTNHKVRQINMIFDNGIILQGLSPYALANDQILSIHITTVRDNMLIISGLNQRLLSQKVYNDGMWYQNSYQATKIKFHDHEAFLSALYNVNRLKFSIAAHTQKPRLSHKQFSPRLTLQRPSNLSSTQAMNTSPSNSYINQKFSKQTKKSTISQNSPYVHNKKQNNQEKSMKKSQIIGKNQKNSMALSSDFNNHPTSVQGQNDGSYIDEFDALFQDQTQTQQLCLNDSFQQFQKKSALDGSQSAKYKVIEQKRLKQQSRERQKAKLQQKVNQLSRQNQKLFQINERLNDELSILRDKSQQKGNKSINQVQAIVDSLKRYQTKLQKDIRQILSKVNQNSENLIRTSSVRQFKQNQDMTLSFSAKKGVQIQILKKQIQNYKQFDVLSFQAKEKDKKIVNEDDELFHCQRF